MSVDCTRVQHDKCFKRDQVVKDGSFLVSQSLPIQWATRPWGLEGSSQKIVSTAGGDCDHLGAMWLCVPPEVSGGRPGKVRQVCVSQWIYSYSVMVLIHLHPDHRPHFHKLISHALVNQNETPQCSEASPPVTGRIWAHETHTRRSSLHELNRVNESITSLRKSPSLPIWSVSLIIPDLQV